MFYKSAFKDLGYCHCIGKCCCINVLYNIRNIKNDNSNNNYFIETLYILPLDFFF